MCFFFSLIVTATNIEKLGLAGLPWDGCAHENLCCTAVFTVREKRTIVFGYRRIPSVLDICGNRWK
jgi:hypothetical protein